MTVEVSNDDARRIWSKVIPQPTSANDDEALVYDHTTGQFSWIDASRFNITAFVDGNGSAVTNGIKGDFQVPCDCIVTAWELVADQAGNIVFDVWKDSYANFPPTVADTICGTEKPTLAGVVKNQDTDLTTWTTSISANDWLRFNVSGAATVTRVTLSLKMKRV